MQLSDFHYDIPDELIAATPPAVRGTSRLLVLDRQTGTITDRYYPDVVDYLQVGDVLVINDTKVIKARLITRKPSGGERELVLVEQHGAHDDWFRHKVIYRRKLIAGDILTIGDDTLMVEKIIGNGIALIRSERNLLDIAAEHGTVPYLYHPIWDVTLPQRITSATKRFSLARQAQWQRQQLASI